MKMKYLKEAFMEQNTFLHFECLQMSQSRKLSKNYEDTALFSRSLREDCLHSTHGQALG